MFTPVTHVYLGVDLGQRSDYTALSAIEYRHYSKGQHDPVTWAYITKSTLRVKELERINLGTSYAKIASELRNVLNRKFYQGRTTMIVDAGGPGLAFLDFFMTRPPEANLIKVMITGSGASHYAHGINYVSRSTLLTNLTILIQNRLLSIDQGLKDSEILRQELRNLTARGTQNTHDDLAMATALAAWQAARTVRPG